MTRTRLARPSSGGSLAPARQPNPQVLRRLLALRAVPELAGAALPDLATLAGQTVIVHPGDAVADGVTVSRR